MSKLVRGIGINDGDYDVFKRLGGGKVWKCPYYALWANILTRCTYVHGKYAYEYKRHHNLEYSGTTICDEWRTFSNFKRWVDKQNIPNWFEMDLDKDILGDGSIYSPETCAFVPHTINMIYHMTGNKKYTTLAGVSYVKSKRRYFSYIKYKCKTYIKKAYFDTELEAHQYWQKGKIEVLVLAANEYYSSGEISANVRDALINKSIQVAKDLDMGIPTTF